MAGLLAHLNDAFPSTGVGKDWVLDANAAWSADIATAMVDVIRPYREGIYMIEQPWSVEFIDHEESMHADWIAYKSTLNQKLDILLFADESMRSADDVASLAPFVDVVNIKLEKAGGFRGALEAIEAVSGKQ